MRWPFPFPTSLPFCQQMGGGGADSTGHLQINFASVTPMIIPNTLAVYCALASVAGAFVRTTSDNRKGLKAPRENWITFLLCSLSGAAIALTVVEQLFRTQAWARESSLFLVGSSFFVGSCGGYLWDETTTLIRQSSRIFRRRSVETAKTVGKLSTLPTEEEETQEP